MNLILAIKQKNEELLLRGDELQQLVGERKTSGGTRSLLIAFVFAPFVAGSAVRFFFGVKRNISKHLLRAIFPSLGLMPFLRCSA